jgi:hypothetical protein
LYFCSICILLIFEWDRVVILVWTSRNACSMVGYGVWHISDCVLNCRFFYGHSQLSFS